MRKKSGLIVLVLMMLVNLSFAHPIKMTTSKLSYDKKSGELILLVNFFIDDFGAHLEKIYHQRGINFSNPGEAEKSMVSSYFNKKFLLKINKKQSAPLLNSIKKIEENVVQARFVIAAGKGIPVKVLEFSDALLFDAFPAEQVNILHLDLPSKTESNVIQFIPSESYKVLNVNF